MMVLSELTQVISYFLRLSSDLSGQQNAAPSTILSPLMYIVQSSDKQYQKLRAIS